MSEAQARARHQERVEELCAAAIRALSGETDLHFRGRRLHRGRRALPLFAPHLHPSLETDDFGSFRGAADGMALRLTHSDAALHRRLCPSDPVERLMFDLLEQIRVEALVSSAMPGVVHNLRHRFEAWSLAFHRSGLTETVRGILLYTVAQMCRSRVTGETVIEETEDLLETTRGKLAPMIGHDLVGLRRHRADQAAYAVHALAIARVIGQMIDATEEPNAERRDSDEERAAFSLMMEVEGDLNEHFATAVSGRSRVLEDSDDGYRIFTTAYDRQVNAADLVRKDLLKDFRERLDRRIAGKGVNIARLARELRLLLGVPTRDGWDGGQEEGTIDGRRLAQLIASPTERRLFRTEHIEPTADCLVSFLIDCSGSMKEYVESLAMLIDVLARALEQAGVASEILGFTTKAWNGGRARRDWVRAGRPLHPGRLNEVCNMVFKNADTSWRRARPQIAALLKGDLFREGIDGEAVDWACARMRARTEERRLLIVVSDGSPMDGATNLANDTHYLDHHLREVVLRQEQIGGIEIYGLGVGLDLSPYYSRSHVLDLAESTGNQIFREIIGMIERRGTR
ncbi:MAG: cobaltochelatase CobT-related protein [Burkholderiaceae bacterium]